MVPAEQDRSHKENFRPAIELFIKKVIHEEKPRDCQYIYLAPGGDYNVQKPLATRPIDHLHRWEELLHVVELLPVGDINMPSAKLQVEWFYMTFHKTDRVEYVRSGRKLREENLQTLTKYLSLSTTLERSKLLIVDLSTRKYEVTQRNKRVAIYKSTTCARCVISPTNADPEGFTRHETTTTTVAVSYAKAGNATMMEVMTGTITRRVPKYTGRVPKATTTRRIPKSVV
jgi:hypothetical protein